LSGLGAADALCARRRHAVGLRRRRRALPVGRRDLFNGAKLKGFAAAGNAHDLLAAAINALDLINGA
jgi:hypothetical protein